MADESIKYTHVCLYHENSDKVASIQKWLKSKKVVHDDLAYDDGTECRAALSTWHWGNNDPASGSNKTTVTFPCITWKDVRVGETIEQKCHTIKELPKDFLSKVELED